MLKILSLWEGFEALAVVPLGPGLGSLAVRKNGSFQSVLSVALGQSFSSDDDHNGSDWCPCGGGDCK